MINYNKLYLKIHFILGVLYLLTLTTVVAQSQPLRVSGVVFNEQGQTFSGVSVKVENQNTTALTDSEGRFNIQANPEDVLVFTYVGYQSATVRVTKAKDIIRVTLEKGMNELDELVVVGYGVQRKGDLTASISQVKPEQIVASSVSSLDQGLQGRAAGVVVLNTSGQPGGATSIRIRGTSSINGTNEPLYVIDGVPIVSSSSSSSTGASNVPSLNPLSTINPNDIASLDVLKDAAATAIYGARGANGVILITTKKGQSGKTSVGFLAKQSFQSVGRKLNLLNAFQLAELGNEVADNDDIERNPIYADINNLKKIGTDWQDEVFQTAPLTSLDLSVSGGNEKTSYFTSGNFFKQDGIVIGSDFTKGTVRLNLEHKISKYFKFGINTNSTFSRSHGVVTNSEGAYPSSIVSWALDMNPALAVFDKVGNYTYENNTARANNIGNPVQDAYESKNRNTALKAIGSTYLEAKPIENLILKTSFGVDYFTLKDQSFTPRELKRAESNKGFGIIGNSDGYTWVWENTANYLKTVNKHSFGALLGFTVQKYTLENNISAAADFEDGTSGFYDLSAGKLRQLMVSGINEWQMLSYLGRLNYNYDNRYLVSFTGRMDGSSKFGDRERYGFFPSVGVAWRVSEESFMKDASSSISNLKIRASVGSVGNEGISPYSKQGLLLNTEAYVGNNEIIKGKVPFTRANNSLRWETTTQYDVGVDLGFWNNRLNITADAYLKHNKNMLLYMPSLLHSGYDLTMKNIGDMQNRGFELTVNALPVDNEKFSWSSDLILGVNRNKVTDLKGSRENLAGSSILGINYWTKITEGQAIGPFYGYKTDGIVQSNENPSSIPFFPGKVLRVGDRKYVNSNGDNVLNEEDLFELGNANPDFTYGFNNTFVFNLRDQSRVSLTVFIQGVAGNEIVNFNKFKLESFDGFNNNSITALNRWTIDNPSNEYPRATLQSHGNIMSDHYVEDGSYLRVKDITLSYRISESLSRKMHLSGLQLSLGIRNMFTITNYSGFDPEVSRFGSNNLSMGADFGGYPIAKSWDLGLKVDF